MEATREIYWNINGKGVMYSVALIAFVILIVGVTQKVQSWNKGRPIKYDNLGLRFKMFFSAILQHDKGVFRGTFRRFMHLFVFYGFLMLSFGTLVIAIQDHFGIPLFYGKKYLILSLLLDLFGLLTMIGIVMATYKRYIDKPDHEDYSFDDAVLLILVFAILLTGFMLEGLRIFSTNDLWRWWSPVGLFFSNVYQKSGLSVPLALRFHAFIWYFHMLLTFSFIAYIPYSKLFHMVASPLNIFLRSFSPTGTLTTSAILSNDADKIGAGRLEEFSKKQLIELDACISCGRCQKGCPAYMSGAPLSPRVVIQSLKKHANQSNSLFKRGLINGSPIIDQVISKETLLACSTCGLCEEKCPMSIEHIKRIVDMRRSLNTEDKGYPLEVETIFKTLSREGNPWGFRQESKYYLGDSQISLLSEKKQTDILYWVGCFGSYESRNQKVSEVMFKILQKAGVDYAVLGTEETCCGDSVRRLGNEKLFQQLALETIQKLKRYEFKTIVTHCPHCFNTLKNEYPQFGGNYQVMHHSEFILNLIKSGKISLKGVLKSKVTFHDPCYLGRYNDVYQAPREVIASIPGLELVEMKNNRTWGFCCGAGGGRLWTDNHDNLQKGNQIHDILVKKALRTETEILATACSLCLTTLTEAISSSGANLESKDIAELVYDVL